MYNSILQFIEEDIKNIEKDLGKILTSEIDVDHLSETVHDKVLKLGKNLLGELYEKLDDLIRESSARKEKWNIDKRNQSKEILDIMGPIKYKRTGYVDKKTGEYIYLLDEILGIQAHQRISNGAAANIIEEAVDSSYRKGGINASKTTPASKQATKRLIHDTQIYMPLEKVKEKKKLEKLYIVADEDHVSAQFWEKKGDLREDKRCNKINTIMPKLICLYEDIINESGEKSSNPRYKLIGKRYFTGVYKGESGNTKLWQEVSDYIEHVYDTDVLKAVYIAGDGAPWIKTGCEVIENSHFILDKFHMMKYINKSVIHLFDSADDAKTEIWEAINKADKKALRDVYQKIIDITEKESKLEEVKGAYKYLSNNWSGIKIRTTDKEGYWKCCAEGQISHVLSARLSSRPMGWSTLGCDQMSKFRAFKMNDGKVIDLLRYQKEKQKKRRQKT